MNTRVVILKFSALALSLCMAASTVAFGEGRSAEKILEEYKALEASRPDTAKRKTPRALQEARSKRQKALSRRAALALELYRVDPQNEQVPKIMSARWDYRLNDPNPKKLAELATELDGVLAKSMSEPLLKEAAFAKASLALQRNTRNPEASLTDIDAFIKRDTTDERGALLLYNLASRVSNPERQAALSKRLTEEYPKSSYAEEIKENASAKADVDSPVQSEGVGKPFELAFEDAITGNPVSVQRLKGKVVVIDFWATWCPPCVAEMPKMKELYQKYRRQGVEFIGVSLDQPRDAGGYDKLVEFVSSREIPWPQFYQGGSFNGGFTQAWDIRAIPTVFLVDAEGKLANIKARGKLEELIPKYLEKSKKGAKR